MDKLMFKVPNGQNPYSTIGKYIRDNTTAIEDMIAVIEIDGITMNELLLVDMHEDEYFVWKSDWWDGEKDIALIDFFPVSDAQKPSTRFKQTKGKWIYSSYDDESGFDESWTCDKCGYSTNIEETNYCPKCGADMREE